MTAPNTGGGSPGSPLPNAVRDDPYRLVLVADDDPLVAAAIAEKLEESGCEVYHTQDFDLAYLACFSLKPAVLVVDQIEESEEGARLLRRLDRLAEAPQVVVLRYAPGPYGAFGALEVSVVAGERWFEELPALIAQMRRRPEDAEA